MSKDKETQEEDQDFVEEPEEEQVEKSKDQKKVKKKTEKTEVITEQKKDEKKEIKKKPKLEKIIQRQITVDFWRTSLHGKKVGIRQKEQLMAKSRQFSKDMELYGEVRFGKEVAGSIGFRSNEWVESDVTGGKLKRLVIRFFDENDRWVASIEENTIKGLMLTLSHKKPTPFFNVFFQGNSNVFSIERIERVSGTTIRMAAPLILEKDGTTVNFFVFDKRRFTFGNDWKVYRPDNEASIVADLDSKTLNIGGKVNINVYDPDLAKNNIFINTLILFSSLIRFWDEIIDTLTDAADKYTGEGFIFKPAKQELELIENPRRMTH